MSQEFLPDDNSDERPNSESALPEQEVLCVTVTGSPKAVRETILTLYRLGFAEVGDWSQLQRAANPKQVMSVLIRRSGSTQSKGDRKSGR